MGTESAKVLIQNVKSGKIQIPSFQRDFVWKRQEVLKLLESIRQGIPIGTITLWEPSSEIRPRLFEHIFNNASVRRLKNGSASGDFDGESCFFEIEDVESGYSDELPGGPIFGVIDGRQRLTSLLMLFGGVAYKRSPQLGGLWALDLKVDIESDDAEPFVFFDWKKCQAFKRPIDWLSRGLFPLWLHDRYQQAIDALDSDLLFTNQSEALAARKFWRRNLSKLNDTFNTLSLETYVLGSGVGLDKVCVVFETINNRGVKVGVYDIVHASLMGQTAGPNVYDLKQTVKEISQARSFPNLGRWFDENDGKGDVIVPQLAMAYKMGSSFAQNDFSRNLSFKGPDLIDRLAVDEFKYCFNDHVNDLEQYAEDFYRLVHVGSRRSAPYPIMFPVYCALRWAQKMAQQVNLDALHSAFKLFFWRACFSGRYDQGFLTRAYVDAKLLWQYVSNPDNVEEYVDSRDAWNNRLVSEFGKAVNAGGFGLERPDFNEIEAALEQGASGALDKALKLVLFSKNPVDIRSRCELPRWMGSGIHLHHIFPESWVKKNRQKEDSVKFTSGVSILVPLSDESNLDWLDEFPRQHLTQWQAEAGGGAQNGPTWHFWRGVMSTLLIDEDCFDALVSTELDNVNIFIKNRTALLKNAVKDLVDKVG